jgi:hypothetical protein
MRKAACDFERDCESDHTAADDDYAVARIGHYAYGSGESAIASLRLHTCDCWF